MARMARLPRAALAVGLNALVLGPALLLATLERAPALAFLALVSAFAGFEALGAEGQDRALDAREGLPRAELATALTTLGLFWLAPLTAQPAPPWSAVVAGAGLMAVGVALRHRAMGALGAGFVSEVRAARRLVQRGPYRYARHPSELGLLALTLGAGVMLASVVAVLAWAAVLVPLVVWRIRAEDRALRACFGRDYEDYARRVGALGSFGVAGSGGPKGPKDSG
ncbi:hypothetical protein PPSIR1_15810 [Plesiocystis pacifica SIR-1]|uniref:Isoprenylcysteine carboxyl methyltransferase n=2 Tax=Plesiocystis pacifica TaxID=191768 RepID=A6GEN8_9BACT|nr:hypothetical protein PPSIR1_15810 [Plesiocystis pacifica SIR-1]